MSLESSDEDDKIIVHHIPWRSPSKLILHNFKYFGLILIFSELDEFVQVLDQRNKESSESSKHYAAKAKERVYGSDAQTSPPVNAPKWAVEKARQKGNIIFE